MWDVWNVSIHSKDIVDDSEMLALLEVFKQMTLSQAEQADLPPDRCFKWEQQDAYGRQTE